MTPADLLRRAADLVEQRSVNVTEGPWRADEYGYHVTSSAHGDVADIVGSRGFGQDDADWIAMLSPQIATPLAAWLRAEAGLLDQLAELDGPDFVPPRPPALALARALLGEAP